MLTMAGKDMLSEGFEMVGTNNEDGEAKKLVEIF